MARRSELRTALFWGFCGIILITIGTLSIVYEPLIDLVKQSVTREMALVKGTTNYDIWSSPIKLCFKVNLFHVTNPEDVMQGDFPNLVERGPYIYDEILEKEVMEVDEENDEIHYMTKVTYAFNKKESGNVSEDDKITILNPAYLGTINKLASLPPAILKQYGNDIPKLFPNPKTIFVTGKVGDILFKGLKLTCNQKKFPELALICQTLKGKKPSIMRDTSKEGVYLYSFFDKKNNTLQGPFIINRGVRDIRLLGDTISFRGAHVQKMYNTESCNTVRGTDSITWPPLHEHVPAIATFSPDICRAIDIEYLDEVLIHGMKGLRYVMTEKMWEPEEIACYCPEEKKEIKCLPKGLMDISKCQEIPIILSEPHFMHGDPELRQYVRGLEPSEEYHRTFVIIEPYTGTPLSGYKKTQLNLQLSKQPVEILTNVSEGYFPLVWCEEGNTPDLGVTSFTYQMHRLLQVLKFLQKIPLILGVFVVLSTLFLYGTPKHAKKIIIPTVDVVDLPPEPRADHVTRRPPRRTRQAFELS